jgi:LasA protease
MPIRKPRLRLKRIVRRLFSAFFLTAISISACSPQPLTNPSQLVVPSPTPTLFPITPLPTRPVYQPGELVDYIAQTGDTLPALASHFNTSIEEILAANPIIPKDATTMPAGFPMKIPIYYQALWGSPYQIIPDNLFINGPSSINFNTASFVFNHPGWLKDYKEYAAGANRSGADIVDFVATTFSVSPQLLLALLEYQSGALSDPRMPQTDYALGYSEQGHRGVYLQLVHAANILNNGYYGWRTGSLKQFDLLDSRLERPDPWQNAATVGLRYYFSQLYPPDKYLVATEAPGLAQTWKTLYGDPWVNLQSHIPGSLKQPEFLLPFAAGKTWAYTGGPHTGWGQGEPLAAIDFAPAAMASGCVPTSEYATAVADGIVARVGEGIAVLDLDGDGNERTGWTILYLHIAADGKAPLYARLKAGDPIGHPSCEGGEATGTHEHIARKYNGEWIPADGPLAFNFEGWIAHNGPIEYQGTLTRYSSTVTACTCANQASQLTAGEK